MILLFISLISISFANECQDACVKPYVELCQDYDKCLDSRDLIIQNCKADAAEKSTILYEQCNNKTFDKTKYTECCVGCDFDPWAMEQQIYVDCLNLNVDCKVAYVNQLNEPDYCCLNGVNINVDTYDGQCGTAGESLFNCYKGCATQDEKPPTPPAVIADDEDETFTEKIIKTPQIVSHLGYEINVVFPEIVLLESGFRLLRGAQIIVKGKSGREMLITFDDKTDIVAITGTEIFVSNEKVIVSEGTVEIRDSQKNVLHTLSAGEKYENDEVTKASSSELESVGLGSSDSEDEKDDERRSRRSSSDGCVSLILGFLVIGGALVIFRN